MLLLLLQLPCVHVVVAAVALAAVPPPSLHCCCCGSCCCCWCCCHACITSLPPLMHACSAAAVGYCFFTAVAPKTTNPTVTSNLKNTENTTQCDLAVFDSEKSKPNMIFKKHQNVNFEIQLTKKNLNSNFLVFGWKHKNKCIYPRSPVDPHFETSGFGLDPLVFIFFSRKQVETSKKKQEYLTEIIW